MARALALRTLVNATETAPLRSDINKNPRTRRGFLFCYSADSDAKNTPLSQHYVLGARSVVIIRHITTARVVSARTQEGVVTGITHNVTLHPRDTRLTQNAFVALAAVTTVMVSIVHLDLHLRTGCTAVELVYVRGCWSNRVAFTTNHERRRTHGAVAA